MKTGGSSLPRVIKLAEVRVRDGCGQGVVDVRDLVAGDLCVCRAVDPKALSTFVTELFAMSVESSVAPVESSIAAPIPKVSVFPAPMTLLPVMIVRSA